MDMPKTKKNKRSNLTTAVKKLDNEAAQFSRKLGDHWQETANIKKDLGSLSAQVLDIHETIRDLSAVVEELVRSGGERTKSEVHTCSICDKPAVMVEWYETNGVPNGTIGYACEDCKLHSRML